MEPLAIFAAGYSAAAPARLAAESNASALPAPPSAIFPNSLRFVACACESLIVGLCFCAESGGVYCSDHCTVVRRGECRGWHILVGVRNHMRLLKTLNISIGAALVAVCLCDVVSEAQTK